MFLFFLFLFCLFSFFSIFMYLCIYLFSFYFLFQKILVFLICSVMKIIFLKNCIFVWLDASPPVFPKDFFNKNGTLPGPPQRLPWPPCPALPCLSPQIDTTGNGQWLDFFFWFTPDFFSLWSQLHLGKLHLGKLHRERAMTGRIFQALPTQTNTTTVAFIDY